MESQKVYIVEYENRIIGVWSTYLSAETFVKGCQQSGLMITLCNIKTYELNTCYCLETAIINQPTKVHTIQPKNISVLNVPNKVNIEVIEPVAKSNPKIDEKNPAYIEMAKQKIEIQHKINMLKIQKKKMEESKVAYANDIKLFELFTESKQKDNNFIIPEIFIKKFELMTKLKEDNNLSWDNFVKNYHHENLYNEYFGLNSYEEMFIECSSDDDSKSDISEELDIESDSDTDTSNNN